MSECLEAVLAQTYDDYEVIIVDNASDDRSLEKLPDLPEKVRVHKAGKNLGFAVANNLAIGWTNAPWVATLNPDTYPAEDWLEKLIDATHRHPNAAMFGSKQVEPGNGNVLDGYGDNYHISGAVWRGLKGRADPRALSEGQCFAPCAAAALYRRDRIQMVGGFDEKFFCYCEDIDLAFRMRLKGQVAIQVPHAVVCHVGAAITGRYSPFSVYYGVRNRTWTYFKNMPGLLFWVFLPAHLMLQLMSLFRAAFMGNLGPTCRGLRDGVKDLTVILEERKTIQKQRSATTRQIAAALTWSPLKMLRRDAHIRPANSG